MMRRSRALPQRRQRHPERVAYIVYVLWMIGHSQRAIAKVLDLRKSQVAGIVDGSEFRNRAAMSDDEIRRRLDELKAIRFGEDGEPLDGGALDRVSFEPQQRDGRQIRGPLRRALRR